MIDDAPTVRLELDSTPETLTLVRGALGGMGELLAIDAELLDDLKTAVSEACNNVVLHAYAGMPGPLGVGLYVRSDAIEVVVWDEGSGIALATSSDDLGQGVGLPVIRALTEHAEFRSRPKGGTEVAMLFSAHRDGTPLYKYPARAAPDHGWGQRLIGDAVVSISPLDFVGPVLGRLARALAARARFSLDRFSDVYLVTDAIASYAAEAATDSRLGFSISTGVRRMDLTIGPFRAGTGERLRRAQPVRDASSALARLSDELEILPDDYGEIMHVVMLDQRRSGALA